MRVTRSHDEQESDSESRNTLPTIDLSMGLETRVDSPSQAVISSDVFDGKPLELKANEILDGLTGPGMPGTETALRFVIPEPSTGLLPAFGLAGLAVRRRRGVVERPVCWAAP